jgi:hypothetical protein
VEEVSGIDIDRDTGNEKRNACVVAAVEKMTAVARFF